MTTSIGFDIFARDTASAKFDHLGNAVDDTSGKFHKVGQAAKVAGLLIAGGAILAGKALVGMAMDAAADEAAQQKLALGLKNATNATDAQVASAEKWITAQGLATGVTDDELRPALQKLAQSTGDVSTAQDQLKIAMDVSAGSGKSLQSVTEAIMKANNGSVGGLSRLGIATKNAAGETMSLDQIMGKAANTFEGQAAAKANTLTGKMDILKLRFDETKETIGAKLIPILMSLSDWILGTGVPAVEKFVQQWKDGEGAGGKFATAAGMVGTSISGTIGFLNEHRTAVVGIIGAYGAFKIAQGAMELAQAASLVILKAQTVGTLTHTVVSGASAVATGVWTAAQWLLNAALTANPIGLVVVAIGLLIGALVIAWNHSDKFREIVTNAFDKVKGAASAAFGWVKDNWPLLLAIITGPIGLATLAVVRNWDRIKDGAINVLEFIGSMPGKAAEALGSLTEKVRTIFDNAMSAGKEKVVNIGGTIMDWIGGIPGKIGNLGAKFGAAGRALLQDFIDGMKNAAGVIEGLAGNIWNAVRTLLNGGIDKINAALAFTISLPGRDISINPPDIPHLAKGGIVTGPTVALIGEAGPEAVVPLNRLSSGGDSGTPLEVHIHLEGKTIVQSVLAYKRTTGAPTLGIA